MILSKVLSHATPVGMSVSLLASFPPTNVHMNAIKIQMNKTHQTQPKKKKIYHLQHQHEVSMLQLSRSGTQYSPIKIRPLDTF